jgi:uncharacterized protein YbjT (DUF2867 family)
MRIVVIGGTGRLGTRLVDVLRERGNDATPAAPIAVRDLPAVVAEVAERSPRNGIIEVGGRTPTPSIGSCGARSMLVMIPCRRR